MGTEKRLFVFTSSTKVKSFASWFESSLGRRWSCVMPSAVRVPVWTPARGGIRPASDLVPMLDYCRAAVSDVVPTVNQHRGASRFAGICLLVVVLREVQRLSADAQSECFGGKLRVLLTHCIQMPRPSVCPALARCWSTSETLDQHRTSAGPASTQPTDGSPQHLDFCENDNFQSFFVGCCFVVIFDFDTEHPCNQIYM